MVYAESQRGSSQFLIHKWITIWVDFIISRNFSLRSLLENVLNWRMSSKPTAGKNWMENHEI